MTTDTEIRPPIHAAIPGGEVDEIRRRHEIYSDDEIAASFFDPDGYKAHSDRATLLARLTFNGQLWAHLNGERT